MSYRAWLLLTAGAGALPAGTFLVLFMLVDRPRYRDRYASLVAGLGILAFLGFAIPFVLTLFTPTLTPAPTRQAWQWAVSIGLRGATVAYVWWLLWTYLTPGRARQRPRRWSPPGPP